MSDTGRAPPSQPRPHRRNIRLPVAYHDAARPRLLHAPVARGTLARKYMPTAGLHRHDFAAMPDSTDTEAGLLLGMSQKRSAHSSLY